MWAVRRRCFQGREQWPLELLLQINWSRERNGQKPVSTVWSPAIADTLTLCSVRQNDTRLMIRSFAVVEASHKQATAEITALHMWHLWFICAVYKFTYLLTYLLTYIFFTSNTSLSSNNVLHNNASMEGDITTSADDSADIHNAATDIKSKVKKVKSFPSLKGP